MLPYRNRLKQRYTSIHTVGMRKKMPQGQAPERIEPRSLGDYLEQMTKSVFQSGMSWRVVNSKWPDIREAMRGFDTEAIANLSPADLDALTQDKQVIRNRRKLEAIIHNARRMLDLEGKHGSFRGYLRSHEDFDGGGGPVIRGVAHVENGIEAAHTARRGDYTSIVISSSEKTTSPS